MHISRNNSEDTTTLVVEGDITIYHVAQIKEELFADYEKLTEKVALDLSGVTEIDTAGVQLLLFAKQFFTSAHKSLFISKSNESVDTVLTVLDVHTQFVMES
jgi:anti-sigma B factor antagonist